MKLAPRGLREGFVCGEPATIRNNRLFLGEHGANGHSAWPIEPVDGSLHLQLLKTQANFTSRTQQSSSAVEEVEGGGGAREERVGKERFRESTASRFKFFYFLRGRYLTSTNTSHQNPLKEGLLSLAPGLVSS